MRQEQLCTEAHSNSMSARYHCVGARPEVGRNQHSGSSIHHRVPSRADVSRDRARTIDQLSQSHVLLSLLELNSYSSCLRSDASGCGLSDSLDLQPSKAAWHLPFDFVALAIAEQRSAEWREHGHVTRPHVRLSRRHNGVVAGDSRLVIAHANLRLQRNDVRRHFVLAHHARLIELIAQIEEVLAVTRRPAARAEDGAQALQVRPADDDSIVPPHVCYLCLRRIDISSATRALSVFVRELAV